MIKKIQIQNFKSLVDVSMPLDKFNCLIGMNGSGKSTVLQGLDFISQLMIGQIEDWLGSRGWDIHDLKSKLLNETNLNVGVRFETKTGQKLIWRASFNRYALQCKGEIITLDGENIFRSTGTQFRIEKQPKQNITFVYQGSLLSVLKDSELPSSILEFRDSVRRIRSLELLSPQLMRKSARTHDVDIGSGGEKLAGYLHSIKGEPRKKLVKLLQTFYPKLEDFKVTNQRAGWKKLSVIEQFEGHRLETDATHLSDGLLRILAVLAQSDSDRSLILLDEIENGINQEIIEKLVDTLVASPQQILVTTHSPLILNFLDDDLARESVQFIYKSPQGESRIRRFFDIPRIGEKLSYMGPGDAFVDTNLESLTQECIELDRLETKSAQEKQG
ncbi:AAA family ATPase [Methylomonas rapida]|uniref:AAA family ATPase n=1 Tax=Methylomonas rapida TaxID=2963939 RepID=A0ABY7GDI5_9GAMM|nr:ATP-binding protein [Methylomonas rapida]WAR43347.1 AAA family ATPase [Methylomonas rapida]